MLSRLRAWLFKPMLDELETRHTQEVVDRQMEAYRLGHQAGWGKGVATGELVGRQAMLNELMDRGDFVSPADIERARKGLVH